MPLALSQVPLASDFATRFPELAKPWQAAPAPAPSLLTLNEPLAAELGLDPDWLRSAEGIAFLVGAAVPEGAVPVAQAYAGHQFGNWVPRLGDGRALLLGELGGRDLHLKGSGRTPFARGGDGKAVVGPMLREHVVSEAMHALGIPTSRALAVVATGEDVSRGPMMPGAILVRVAASHLRVGTFQYALASGDRALLRQLADYAIDRHHPAARSAEDPYLGLFGAVVEAQASLVARWMAVGFVHGVMNTDNVTISGETIDYGPCAFMDAHDARTVFSSIDAGGRYAYGNQPHLMQWDLARLAETLVPLGDADGDAAVAALTERLDGFADRYNAHFSGLMRDKLGLRADPDGAVAMGFLALLQETGADHTGSFRALSSVVRSDDAPLRARVAAGSDGPPAPPADALDAWLERYRAALSSEARDPSSVAAGMDAVNPVYVPRNHLVEDALTAAHDGDTTKVEWLLEVLARPFDARPGLERFAEPAPPAFAGYQTFCGT